MIDTLREIAEEVEEGIKALKFGRERGDEVCTGADGTPTSAIDISAENIVLDYIRRNKLKLNILSEEIGFIDNKAKETLVLDPIDGTTNSIEGIPMYTISMAIGRSSLSDIHTAYIRNLATGEEFTAEKGKGAFHNGKKIRTSKKFDPKKAKLSIYLGRGASEQSFEVSKRIKSTRSFGCTSLEMAMVAMGAMDGYLLNSEVHNRSTRLVDIAASSLILREAGGEIYTMNGVPLDMPFDILERANFLAVANREVFDFVMNGNLVLRDDGEIRYGIYANMSLPNAVDVTKRVMKLMKGQNIVLDTAIAEAIGIEGCDVSKMKVDAIITIGGDGTILRALHNVDKPIFAINAGGVGFLTEIQSDNLEEGIARLIRGEYTIHDRPKIMVTYKGKTLGEALNEVVIHSDSVAKIRRFKIYVNDLLTTDVRADGILLSTPIGSTSYVRSLGGPIMDHGVDAWVLMPMAAFQPSFGPMVIPTSVKVTVEAVLDKGCILVIDGQKEINVPGGSKIVLTRSPRTASFIMFETDFYSRFRNKLGDSL